MKVIVVSDLHGSLIPIKEKFDLLLMCGDCEPVWDQSRQYHKEWLKTDFANWINNLPYSDEESRVVMIAGNHSFFLEGITNKQKGEWLSNINNNRLVYLDNEEYDFVNKGKTYKIFGCPYCKPLYGWPFCRENYTKYYDFIPNGMDILLLHDAPDIYNGGMSTEGRVAGMNFGNKELVSYIEKVKPKYCFFGHIHSSPLKKMTEYNGTILANASILNEDYDIAYDPIIFDMD